jgi:hypothetical protein
LKNVTDIFVAREKGYRYFKRFPGFEPSSSYVKSGSEEVTMV